MSSDGAETTICARERNENRSKSEEKEQRPTKGRIFKEIRETSLRKNEAKTKKRMTKNRFLWSFLLLLLFVFTILIFLKIDLELLLHFVLRSFNFFSLRCCFSFCVWQDSYR